MRCWPIAATHFIPKGYPILLFMISIRLKWIITNTIIKIVASCHFGLCCCLKSRSLSLSPRRRAPSRQDTDSVLTTSWLNVLRFQSQVGRPFAIEGLAVAYWAGDTSMSCTSAWLLTIKTGRMALYPFEENGDEELRNVFCLCNKNLFTWNFNIALRTHK